MPKLKVITTLLIENDKETVENRIWPWKKNGTKMVKVYRHVKCRNYNYRVTPYNWVCPNISHNTCIRCLGSLYPGMIMYRVNHSALFNSFQVLVIIIPLVIWSRFIYQNVIFSNTNTIWRCHFEWIWRIRMPAFRNKCCRNENDL